MMYFNIILLARSTFTEKNGLNIMYVIKLSAYGTANLSHLQKLIIRTQNKHDLDGSFLPI